MPPGPVPATPILLCAVGGTVCGATVVGVLIDVPLATSAAKFGAVAASPVGLIDDALVRPIGQHLHPLDRAGGNLRQIDKDLAAKARDRVDRRMATVDQVERIEVAELRLAATGGVLVGVVGIANARVAPVGERRGLLANEVEDIVVDASLLDRIGPNDAGPGLPQFILKCSSVRTFWTPAANPAASGCGALTMVTNLWSSSVP